MARSRSEDRINLRSGALGSFHGLVEIGISDSWLQRINAIANQKNSVAGIAFRPALDDIRDRKIGAIPACECAHGDAQRFARSVMILREILSHSHGPILHVSNR